MPNTDVARLRAFNAALDVVDTVPPQELLYTQKLLLQIKPFVPLFEQALEQYNSARQMQAQLSRKVSETSKSARMYLSHFIQVFNMCIARGEIKSEVREMLGLADGNLPDLSNDVQLLERGKNAEAQWAVEIESTTRR